LKIMSQTIQTIQPNQILHNGIPLCPRCGYVCDMHAPVGAYCWCQCDCDDEESADVGALEAAE